MDPLHRINHYLETDLDGVIRHLDDFVSVPAFVYDLQQDKYLSISRSILEPLGMVNRNLNFQSFLERMHPADCARVFSIYAQDVPTLMRHRKSEPLPKLRGFDFRMMDKNLQWRHGVVKLDVVGYDERGMPDKLFAVFMMDDTPLEMVEKIYEKRVEDIFGQALTERIKEVRAKVQRLSKGAVPTSLIMLNLREKRIISALARGLSTHEIADQLHLSFHTIEDYRKKLLKKFDARNTVQMVLKASGVLPDSIE